MDKNARSDETKQSSDSLPAVEDARFAQLLAETRAEPHRPERWDALEARAADLQSPDEVSDLLVAVVEGDIAPALAVTLGERAARFHAEWFGDDAPALVRVLTRVLMLAPTATFPLERLAVVLTAASRFTELLDLYDRAIAAAPTPARRLELLDEAAHVAKDFAADADRAIGYLQQLAAARPLDAQVFTSLERLLDRQERFVALIQAWKARIDAGVGADEAATLRARIAACFLDRLRDPSAALAEIRQLLDAGEEGHALPLLERVLGAAEAGAEVRERALTLLRSRYDEQGRSADVIRVVEAALARAVGSEERALRRELGGRLKAAGSLEAAMGQLLALLALAPDDAAAEPELHALADATGAHAQLADGFVAAAEAATTSARKVALLSAAAELRAARLGDLDGATRLYERVLDVAGADAQMALPAARRLAALYAQAGRARERLDALDRLAALELAAGARRDALADLAAEALALGDTERALDAHARRVAANPRDLEALGASITLLAQTSQWTRAIDALRQRAGADVSALERRADLTRIAQIQASELGDLDAAIGTWTNLAAAHGEDAIVVDALAALYEQAGRNEDLAALLERAGARDTTRVTELLARLGAVLHTRLGDTARAAQALRSALRADPTLALARDGLRALLDDAGARATAVEGLVAACEATNDGAGLLSLVEARYTLASSDAERARILTEAARLEEQVRGDLHAALMATGGALKLSPDDRGLEEALLRLTDATGDHGAAAKFLEDAAVAAGEGPRAHELWLRAAALLSGPLSLPDRARDDAERVARAEPARRDVAALVIASALRSGDLETAISRVFALAGATGRIDATLLDAIEASAAQHGAWARLAQGVEIGAVDTEALDATQRRDLERRVAAWYRDRVGDAVAAEAAFVRALAHDPDDVASLRALVALRRSSPSLALHEALLALAALTPGDVAALREAAVLAVETLGDTALARTTLERLFERASLLLRRTGAEASAALSDAAAWAHAQLVAMRDAAGDTRGVYALLLEGATLPLPAAQTRAMRVRAAALAAGPLGDGARAIDLYRGVLAETPDDADAQAQLAALFEREERLSDLLVLQKRALETAPDTARRLALRLDIARLVGELEARGGRLEALRANLDEQPGHAASIAAISAILEEKHAFPQLVELLTAQAQRVEKAGDTGRAATLYASVADVAERGLGDVPRALVALRKVVALAPTTDALDTLARLHAARGEHRAAIDWLERRLASGDASERTAGSLRLAAAMLAAGQRERAVQRLEASFTEDPASAETRELLARLYRESQTWAPLGRLLAEDAARIADDGVRLERLREATDIYVVRLRQPELAVPLLEQAVQLAPDDRGLRRLLADGYRVSGRLDDARTVLDGLVAEFGRRRTPERAGFHFQLARVARARGETDTALEQLDLAASMDAGNASVTLELGQLASEAGQLDRAERAYRALLLQARKSQDDSLEAVGVPEAQLELSRLAAKRGQDDQARELLESAVASAAQSNLETLRFVRALDARGEHALARRVLEQQLAATADAAERAPLLGTLANLLDHHLGLPEAALDARLEALTHTPDDDALHAATREVARRAARSTDYVSALHAHAEHQRRAEEHAAMARTLLRVGTVLEEDVGDLAQAAAVYGRVEQGGDLVGEARFALARIAARAGDTAEELRVLALIVADESGGATTDALYRLAELRLAGATDEATLDDGLELLDRGLATDPRWGRAAAILRAAASSGSERVLNTLERVARQSQDAAILLDYLELRTAREGATLDEIREGVAAADGLGASERAEQLLARGVELARDGAEGLAGALWTATELGARRLAAGDARAALHWLGLAFEAAHPDDAFDLGVRLAQAAEGPDGDLEIAAATWERLRERDPSDRAVWLPLLGVYRRLGDAARLGAHVASTLDALLDPAERNAVRMEQARFLLAEGRDAEAAGLLREMLGEEPAHAEAGALLGEVLTRLGSSTELLELVERQLDAAKDRGDAEAVVELTLRLVGLYRVEARRDDSLDAVRSALDFAPGDRALLALLLELLGPDAHPRDRAEAMERLLAIETGAEAATLALALADLYLSLEEESAAERALATGHAAAPGIDALRARLDAWYRERGDHAQLAGMLALDASRTEDATRAVAFYREAAALHRDALADAAGAARALDAALARTPDDHALLAELVAAHVAAGALEDALARVDDALARGSEGAARATLLRARADLHAQRGDDDAVLRDLEAAYALVGAEAAGALTSGLAVAIERAAARGAIDTERALTFRLVAVLEAHGAAERARDALAAWLARVPNDVEALRAALALDAAGERWADLVELCNLLVQLEEGDAQVEIALRLDAAAAALAQPELARSGLEHAFFAQPGDERVRERLRALYAAVGADRELAAVLLSDAESATEPAARFESLRRAGMLLVRADDPAGALAPLVAAYDLRPDDHDVTVTLVDAYTATGAHAEAGQLLEMSIAGHGKRRSPELAVLQQRMGRLAGAAGARDTELEWYKVAVDSDKNNGDIAADLAELAMALGDSDTALKALRAITLMKQTGRMSRAVAFLRQAQIAHHKADPRRAVLWARKAKEEDPTLAEADEFLREIGES
jgi:tetratricopeptide (TPR) repeat protein